MLEMICDEEKNKKNTERKNVQAQAEGQEGRVEVDRESRKDSVRAK